MFRSIFKNIHLRNKRATISFSGKKSQLANETSNGIVFNRLYSSTAVVDISGIYPPITTTFDEQGNIAYDKLAYNLNKWKAVPFRGYVVLGSTGEFPFLDEDVKIKLVEHVKKSNQNDKLIIVGTGCESTHKTIAFTNKISEVGANAALVVSPFFYKGRMTEEILYDHYIKVAESSKIPIILYNVPANTGIDLSTALVAKLADHPNIVGLKDSGGDITKIGLIVHKTRGKQFQILAGSAGFLYPALCVGCVGGVLALANPLGEPICLLYQFFCSGNHDEARKLQHRLISPNLAVTKMFGIPGVKFAMDLLGYHGGLCHSPLKSLNEVEKAHLRKEFEENGFI